MNQEGVGDQTTSSKALTGGRGAHTHTREREREREREGSGQGGEQETGDTDKEAILLPPEHVQEVVCRSQLMSAFGWVQPARRYAVVFPFPFTNVLLFFQRNKSSRSHSSA